MSTEAPILGALAFQNVLDESDSVERDSGIRIYRLFVLMLCAIPEFSSFL